MKARRKASRTSYWYCGGIVKPRISVEEFKGKIRLRWSYQGKRFSLNTQLPDSQRNQASAIRIANIIEGDIGTGNYDESLDKYRLMLGLAPKHQAPVKVIPKLTVHQLFEQFIEFKSQEVYKRTLEKYHGLLPHLDRKLLATEVDSTYVSELTAHLRKKVGLEPITLKERLHLLKATWTWGMNEGLVDANPWQDAPRRIKVPPKQQAKPFSRQEMSSIIQGFKDNRYYSHYSDYVLFLFSTGCRTAEAIGLRWRHLNDDCSTLWIGESLSRGVRKATKTNKARTIALTPALQAMLQARRPINPDPEALVFQAPRGGPINDHNFRNRAWVKVLSKLGIDYRKPYTTRHTLVSHGLAQGMAPAEVAQLTGHTVQTLYEHYAGNVNSRPRLPDILYYQTQLTQDPAR